MATRFLPNQKQRGIFAIYALCRFIDDLVDEADHSGQENKPALKEISRELDKWKEKLFNLYRGVNYDNPILIAYADVLRKYDISEILPLSLMEGVCSDLYKDRYQTFDELYNYSYKVASVVGLMTSEVFGYDEPRALDYAVDLGIAMQITNILRDIGEDLKQNRIYLPQEDLQRFSISEQDLFDHQLNDSFKKMMQFQIARARQFYEKSKKGIALLDKDSRLPVYLAYYNYSGILKAIEANDYNVFTRRAYLGTVKKVSIVPRIVYHSKFGSN